MNRKMIFYSPLDANMPAHTIGGAEAGCKRTVEILRGLGYELNMVSKPTMADGAVGYVREACRSLGKLLKLLRDRRAPVLYLIGYYEMNVYLEWLIVRLAKMFGKKVIYEPKNGNLVSAWEKRGRLYQSLMNNVLRTADIVFCQGMQYVDFLKEKLHVEGVYIPNYVMNRYLHSPVQQEGRPLHLVFFGRISPGKNVDLILKISAQLAKRGVENELTLIGACDEAYQKKLDAEVLETGVKVRFTGRMDFDHLSEELRKMDFFIFPSTNHKEGHSNALTEAMAMGVIPVASPAGFNREVAGDERFIVSELSAEAYAQRVMDLMKSGRMDEMRQQIYDHVKNNYTETIVTERMKQALDSLNA